MSSEGTKSSRQDEAAAWFAAERAGAMLVEQRDAFDVWRADPRNQAALDAMYELWRDLAVLKGATPSPTQARRPPLVAIAAAALVLILSGGLAVSMLAMGGDSRIATAAGQQKSQSMQDGSLIAVNVASNLSYRIDDTQRVVTMSDGEAAFSVKPDPVKPFVVRAGEFEVRAVGTAFNVRQRDGMIQVAVSEGAVDICRASQGVNGAVLIRLSAGQLLEFPSTYSAAAFTARPSPVPPDQVSEWRMRIVTYEDASVGEVVDDLNRYFERKLRVKQPELSARRVTVRLRVDDRERAIETLAGLLSAHVQRAEKGDVLTD